VVSSILFSDQEVVERVFGRMMPRGAGKLALSKVCILGLGTRMIKGVMQSKNVDSLPELIQSARGLGVRTVACDMTLDVM
jgi:peroxiredoxin family protein